jgi:fructose-specific phosphotransferase system IIC component
MKLQPFAMERNGETPESIHSRTSIRPAIVISLIAVSILVAGCFPGGGYFDEDRRAGFFTGIWHGWIAPVSLVYGFFNDDVRIYEEQNVGWWYDLGFYVAVIGGFGSFALIRRKSKRAEG